MPEGWSAAPESGWRPGRAKRSRSATRCPAARLWVWVCSDDAVDMVVWALARSVWISWIDCWLGWVESACATLALMAETCAAALVLVGRNGKGREGGDRLQLRRDALLVGLDAVIHGLVRTDLGDLGGAGGSRGGAAGVPGYGIRRCPGDERCGGGECAGRSNADPLRRLVKEIARGLHRGSGHQRGVGDGVDRRLQRRLQIGRRRGRGRADE